MPDMYYERLETTDKRLEYIAKVRDRKINRLNKKIKKHLKKSDKVMKWAAMETRIALDLLGMEIPQSVKEKNNGEHRNSRTDSR